MEVTVHSSRQFSILSNIHQRMVCNVEDTQYQEELINHLNVELGKPSEGALNYYIEELQSILKTPNSKINTIFYATIICIMYKNITNSFKKEASPQEVEAWFNIASKSLFENTQHLIKMDNCNKASTAGALVMTRQLIEFAKEFNYDEFRLHSRASSLTMKLEFLKQRNGAMLLCQ